MNNVSNMIFLDSFLIILGGIHLLAYMIGIKSFITVYLNRTSAHME